jgi:hypothetical protein
VFFRERLRRIFRKPVGAAVADLIEGGCCFVKDDIIFARNRSLSLL